MGTKGSLALGCHARGDEACEVSEVPGPWKGPAEGAAVSSLYSRWRCLSAVFNSIQKNKHIKYVHEIPKKATVLTGGVYNWWKVTAGVSWTLIRCSSTLPRMLGEACSFGPLWVDFRPKLKVGRDVRCAVREQSRVRGTERLKVLQQVPWWTDGWMGSVNPFPVLLEWGMTNQICLLSS